MQVFRENEKTVWADGSLSENEGKGEKCEACGRGGAFPFEPREHESAPDAVESGISNEARGSGPILCYVRFARSERWGGGVALPSAYYGPPYVRCRCALRRRSSRLELR